MIPAEILPGEPSSERDSSRRTQVLAAAERAFARQGFHAATMQDVAAEAAMSPGNLYRYFDSKDAIVAGLCKCDQAKLARDFTSLAASGDILPAIEMMLRKRLIEEPRERLQLMIEIWAESTRNPVIAGIQSEAHLAVRRCLAEIVAASKHHGAAASDLDEDFAVRALLTIGAGLFKRRVHEPDFDGEAEVALALGLIAAVFRGAARVYRPSRARGNHS
jgi:TetR/AcrR family transcriptional regulator, repressor for uid operon